MKRILLTLLIGLVGLSAFAQQQAPKTWAVSGTGASATLTWGVASGLGDGIPTVLFSAWGSDKAGSVLQFYTINTNTFITNTVTAAVTNILRVNSTNGFAPNDVVLLRSLASDLYQRALINNVITGGLILTNPSVTSFLVTNAMRSGDIVYHMVAGAQIPVGITTNNITGFQVSGQFRKPLLFELDSTTVGKIYGIGGRYE